MRRAKTTDTPATRQAAADACLAACQALAEPGWTVHYARPDGSYSESLSGLHWLGPAPPPEDHQCAPQTRGREMDASLPEPCACGSALAGMLAESCICGAIRHGPGGWHQRNQRRLDSAHNPGISPWDRRLLTEPWLIPFCAIVSILTFLLAFLATGGSLTSLAHLMIP